VGLALVMLGRVSEAWPQFDSAARAFRSPASQLERWEWRIVPAVVGLPVDTAELPAARAALEQLERDSLIGARAAWALALDALDRGDPAAAQPSLARLSARAPRDSAAARLSLLLKGFATGRAGRFEEALAQTQPLLRYNQAVRVGDPFARTVLYLLRAEWFERLGRWQEAERTLLWYQNSDIDGWAEGVAQAGDADAALGGIARFRRGLLLLEHADAAQGCRELKRLNQLWQRADSGYAGLKRELATRLVACRR
jgi:tetratricopeptide (TPR) repeat protein